MNLGKTDLWIVAVCIVIGSLIGVYYSDIKTLYKNLTSSDSYTLVEALDREIDIGAIAKDQEAKAFFGIVNTGNNPLEIERVETTCHCTEGTFQLLPAGLGIRCTLKWSMTSISRGSFIRMSAFMEISRNHR